MGVCVGDELLETPSCGQLPGHRMEGPPTALPDERGSRKTGKRSREQRGKEREEGALGLWSLVCVWVQVVHHGSVSTGWDSNRIRVSEAKAADQTGVLTFILVVILWENMRQPRRGKLGDRQTCQGGGGARRTDTGAEAVGVRQEERATSRRRLSKGKPAIWGPSLPPLPSPQAPPTPGSPSALPSAGADSGCARCGRAARPGTNSLFVARRRRSTARRVTTSARAGGGRAETAALSFVDVAWQPSWRCWATPADCSFS